jgi:long-chain acyl-CoA synthetase
MPFTTVFSLLDHAARKFGRSVALAQPISGTKPVQYQTYSWQEYRDAAVEIACGLRSLGVKTGDLVALYSETRAEFYLADQGVMATGAIAAALYTSNPVLENLRNLQTCGARVLFVEDSKTMRLLQEGMRQTPVEGITWVLLTGEEPQVLNLTQLRDMGRQAMAAAPDLFRSIQAEVEPSSYAVLYLTSGATGEPKMGLVTHHAIVSNVEMGPYVLPLSEKDRSIAFLPSAHIAQRVVMEFLPPIYGMPVWFSESLMRLPQEMQAVKPTMLLAPPRVWERIYSSVCTEIKRKGGLTEKLFYAALGMGLKAAELRRAGKSVPAWISAPLALADGVIFKKIRERLGGRLRFPVSGAAPLGKDLATFFGAVGLPLVEGYGLTEGGVTMLNPIDRIKPGSIGKPLPGIEVKLGDDGELLIRSTTLFSGYYNDPASTALVLQNGWLHTGDIASIDEEGYIAITGRKKELLVSSNGKKIYPARVEMLFKSEPLISQIVLVGDRLPYVTALFTLNEAAAKETADKEGEVRRAVSRVNRQLAQFEQIRKFKILDTDFSVAAGELTPTMKVRRSKVLERYKELVAEMYQGKEESH